jgi:pyrimidine-nucleoside phosphorylase
MITSELLKKKRLGLNLSKNEIDFLIKGLINRSVSDIQASAFLTSSCINGLNPEEINALTFAMRDSGFRFDFSKFGKPVIDKHSTGGVGDKLSLLIVPICMSFDIALPMISGRGLGHTGGTVDKLESISGFNIRLNTEQFYDLIEKNNAFMACQTDDIAPADRILYHIRDVTGNVESVGLITASILSKKLVEGLDGLVIDLKVGNGAFMHSLDEAKELAEAMASVARLSGLKMRLLFTSMDQPLGYKIGNWLEIEETIDSLKGNAPEDIRFLTEELSAAMLLTAGIETDKLIALEKIRKVWDSGEALNNFYKMVNSQGGNIEESYRKHSKVEKFEVKSAHSGFINQIDTLYMGLAGIMLGAGRKTLEDKIDYAAGIILHKKIGDEVKFGEVIATIQATDKFKLYEAADLISNLIIISDIQPEKPKLILDEWIVN